MSAVHDLSLTGLAAAIRAKRLSPVEITDHYLNRISAGDSGDTGIGAYVTVAADLALEQARKAERTVLSARDPDELPPLLGIPVPVKDLTAVAGVPTRYGSAAYGAAAPGLEDDGVVRRLREAGAVIIGKTNTPEFGLAGYTEGPIAPPARTPWDRTRSAGGSSGGAAAAVAAGLAPVAHGSDGGGSIRIPASACGVVGLKPTRGRVSNGPHGADVFGLATHGPLARRVADAALLLDALAHTRPGDAAPAPVRGHQYASDAAGMPGSPLDANARLRIAAHAGPASEGAEVHPECRAAYEDAIHLLRDLGHEVEEVAPPVGPEFMAHFAVLWSATAAPLNAEPVTPLTAWLRARGRSLSAADVVRSLTALQRLTRPAAVLTDRYDAILTPTLAQPPVPIGHFHDQDPAENFARQCAFSPFASVYNVTGQPAISLPTYWTPDDLPIGIMLAGAHGAEPTLISLAAQLEQAVDWPSRVPPTW